MKKLIRRGTSNLQPMAEEKKSSSSPYFLPYEDIFYWLIVLAGISLRWYDLDARPIHHDESLHATYGRYFFEDPKDHHYKYMAMLHGPLLYNLYRITYTLFGMSDWSARAGTAFFGTLFIFMPLAFHRYLSKTAVLALTTAISLSPTLIYWSRFAAHDYLVLFSMLLMLYGTTLAPDRYRSFSFLVGLTLHFCVKANAFITCALLIGFLVYDWLMCWLITKEQKPIIPTLFSHFYRHRLIVLSSLAISAFLYCYFYSSGFRYQKGILDGLYRETLTYWWGQHSQERIKGPFLFHFYMLAWYELPFVVAFFLHLFLFYKQADKPIRIAGAVCWGLALVLYIWNFNVAVEQVNFWKLFKLKGALDIFGLIVFIGQAVIVTTNHLLRRERTLALWGYFFTATLFSYSFVGEKVPWLAIYPFAAGLIYFTLFFDNYFKNHPLALNPVVQLNSALIVIGGLIAVFGLICSLQERTLQENIPFDPAIFIYGIVIALIGLADRSTRYLGTLNLRTALFIVLIAFLTRTAILTNFAYAGEATEFISQVHTTKEFHDLAHKIREEVLHPPSGRAVKVLVEDDATWPLTWYFRNLPGYRFQAAANERSSFDYIFQKYEEHPSNIPKGYTSTRIHLRGWWVPNYNKMTLRRFLIYALNHKPWNESGFTDVLFLKKEG